MFDFLFGWRKASKCKKLAKKARRRLNMLKNKRCCIIEHQRNDVVKLIKDGHSQIAFNRVEQIYEDECIVVVYDLLAHFCQFISRQLPYIRRHKDCPNDINEAISSIIFASARLAGQPELLRIRKLFKDRYGEGLEDRALNLLPGNLVNFQIRQILSFEKITNEAKYKLFKEITTDVLGESLRLELDSQDHLYLQAIDEVDGQGVPATGPKPTNVDISESQFDFDHANIDHDPLIINHLDPESSSSNESTTYNVPKDIVYLDDIQEFKSPLNNGKNGTTDQRFFLFKSSDYDIVPLLESLENHQYIYFDVKKLSTKQIGEPEECLRATSTPRKWCLTKCVDESGMMRSPVQPSPPHVHPKLPDYDELVAMFMALKKQNLEKLSRF